MTFTARTDRRLIRTANRSNRFVLAEFTAPESQREGARPPVNLAFVLDRSGSMSGQKIELAKRAVEDALARLHADDRFSIVVYDDRIDVVVPGTLATTAARRDAVELLRTIDARGSTNLGEGWLRGAEQVALALSVQGVNRCLLLTDGLANIGMTDPEELARHAGELRARGVSTTTFGVGDDFDERLLQAMAAAGGGHFYYIADAASIGDHVTSEVGEALDIVARDVVLTVTAPIAIDVEALSPYPVRRRDGLTEIVLGDLVSAQQVELVLRVAFPYGEIGRTTGAMLEVRDRDSVLSGGEKFSWAYASDRDVDLQERDREVDRAVARVFAARARQEAVRLNRQGDFRGARHAIESTAKRIRGYAGRDSELRSICHALEAEAAQLEAPMLEMSRKVMFAEASYLMNSRSAMGKSIRNEPRPRPGTSGR